MNNMNTDQLRNEYEYTLTSKQIWLLGYWAECELRGEEPVSIPAQELQQCWENQQLIDQLKGQGSRFQSFKTQQDYHWHMLTCRIKEHIASWEAEAVQPKPTAQP